jgi:manganese efflux pump family protein
LEFGAILLIAVGLAMDCFAVSLGIGTTEHINGPRPVFRLAFHFGLFQALMPVLGWLAGYNLAGFISSFDHWIAFGLLSFVGVRMIKGGLSPDTDEVTQDPSRGRTLVMLSVATSIDAFAVGFSLAALGIPIVAPAIIIGLTAGLLSLSALFLGRVLGTAFGRRMEIIGGLILIAIGLRVLLSHLLG